MRVALPAAEDASSEDRLEDDGQEQRHHSVALRNGRHDTRSSKVDSACTTIRVQPFGALRSLSCNSSRRYHLTSADTILTFAVAWSMQGQVPHPEAESRVPLYHQLLSWQ